MKAINLAIKDRNGLVLGATQGLRNELRQNAIRVVLEKLTPIKAAWSHQAMIAASGA